MNIEMIETFPRPCAKRRSFNRTAARLGVTQSTVSGACARGLEAGAGMSACCERQPRAARDLTTEGLRFAPHARGLRLAWTAAGGRAVRGTGGQAVDDAHRHPARPSWGGPGRRLGRGRCKARCRITALYVGGRLLGADVRRCA